MAWHTGAMCATCEEGSYSLLGGCHACPPLSAGFLRIAVGLAAMAAVCFFVQRGTLDEHGLHMLSRFGSFMQTLFALVSFHVPWPHVFREAWRYIQLAIGDLAAFSPQCFLHGNVTWYLTLGITIAFVFTTATLLLLTQRIVRGLAMCYARTRPRGNSTSKTLYNAASNLDQVLIVFLGLAFMPLLRTLLQTDACVDTPGGVRLSIDMSVSCSAPGQVAVMVSTSLVTIIVGFFAPIAVGNYLHRLQRDRKLSSAGIWLYHLHSAYVAVVCGVEAWSWSSGCAYKACYPYRVCARRRVALGIAQPALDLLARIMCTRLLCRSSASPSPAGWPSRTLA